MGEILPLDLLIEEAMKSLGEIKGKSWEGNNGRRESFVLWAGGEDIDIKIQNGFGLTNDTFYKKFLRLCPLVKRVIFYKFSSYINERKAIEENLKERGYLIEEGDLVREFA